MKKPYIEQNTPSAEEENIKNLMKELELLREKVEGDPAGYVVLFMEKLMSAVWSYHFSNVFDNTEGCRIEKQLVSYIERVIEIMRQLNDDAIENRKEKFAKFLYESTDFLECKGCWSKGNENLEESINIFNQIDDFSYDALQCFIYASKNLIDNLERELVHLTYKFIHEKAENMKEIQSNIEKQKELLRGMMNKNNQFYSVEREEYEYDNLDYKKIILKLNNFPKQIDCVFRRII